MKLTDFIYRTVASHNTSLGDNLAFPPREDMAFDYLVVKERFDEVIRNVESEFGYIPTPDEAVTLLSELITLAQRKEEPLKDQLETLAYNIVNETLCVPKETVILRTSLVNRVEPLNNIRLMPEDDDEGNEGYTFDDVDEIIFTNKLVMKRRLINSLTQGVSYRLMLKYLDDDQIYEWDDELVDIYFKIVYLNDYLLFTKKEKISDKNPMLGSYVDTDLGEGEFKTEIDAQALVYPLLLQETFRGFFEICGSYCLPDDKKKANMILHKADFLVAEAWDLRLGVGLWDKIEACYDISVTSHIPYVFTSLAGLQGDEFNDMMQNVFCHTRKAQEYIKGIIDDVEYDQAYQTFKQDIQASNLKKCLINDDAEEEDTITESGMRAWKYWEDIQATAKKIIEDKIKILNNNGFQVYPLNIDGDRWLVYASNHETFLKQYPDYESVEGFTVDKTVVLWINRNSTFSEIAQLISHELEHVIDDAQDGLNTYQQYDLMNKAYSYNGMPDFIDPQSWEQITVFNSIKNVIYHLWIKTETNAFVAQAIAKNSELIPQLEYEINFLDGTYADDFSEIWDYFSNVLDRKYKNWYGHDEITPQLIKKHFIAQSRHRLDKFKKICDKKKRYAKMHGIDMDSDIKDDVCYLMFPDECSTAEYGPYIWNGVVKAYQHSELPDSVLCRKQNDKGYYNIGDLINGTVPDEDREFYGDSPLVHESKSKQPLLTEGITDKTYHYCSLPTLYQILETGKLKMTFSSNHADAYHKTKLFYLSTQRSKNNRLGYAGNGKREVRIELDGYSLKANGYEGMPVDYWGGSMGKQSDIGLNASRLSYGNREFSDQDKRDITISQGRSSNFEFEDRIFSSKPYIPIDYINRVDCLITDIQPIDRDILLKSQETGISVYFYNNEKDFVMQTENTVNNEVLKAEGEREASDFGDNSKWRQEKNAELCTELCCLLLYYNYYNNYDSSTGIGETTLSELKNILDEFNLGMYYDYASRHLKYKMNNFSILIDDISNSIRKLNTDSWTKSDQSDDIMMLAQYVLNHYGCKSLIELKIYFGKHPWQRERPKEVKVKEFVKCVRVDNYDDYRILKADNKRFWDYMDKEFFYNEISRLIDNDEWSKQNGYEDDVLIHHKSKDAQSFLKYIQWLMHNNNLSLYDGATVVGKLFSLEDLKSIFGFDMTPCTLNKAEYIKEEDTWHIPLQEQDDIRLELFGSDQNYYRYKFPESEN